MRTGADKATTLRAIIGMLTSSASGSRRSSSSGCFRWCAPTPGKARANPELVLSSYLGEQALPAAAEPRPEAEVTVTHDLPEEDLPG